MKRSIIKKTESISITYCSGNFSNNLQGQHWEWEVNNDHHISIFTDMGWNLSRTRKDSNEYYDALELIKTHSDLKMVQIFSDPIAHRIAVLDEQYPGSNWTLVMSFRDHGEIELHPDGIVLGGGEVTLNFLEPIKALQ